MTYAWDYDGFEVRFAEKEKCVEMIKDGTCIEVEIHSGCCRARPPRVDTSSKDFPARSSHFPTLIYGSILF